MILFAFIVTAIPFIVYLTYIVAALTSKPKTPEQLNNYPQISIVIPSYNEESSIADRLNNLAEIYPADKMEIIVSNDGSADKTVEIAQKAIEENSLQGKVITFPRSGVNKAINRGINESANEIVVITGADGLFDEKTIPDLLSVLLSSPDIGAVSGDLIPIAKGDSVFSNSEAAYRSIYGKICTWESKVHSTYCFNGPVVAFKKEASSTLNTRRGRMMQVWHCLLLKKVIDASMFHLQNSMNMSLINSTNKEDRKYAGLQDYLKQLSLTKMYFQKNAVNSRQ